MVRLLTGMQSPQALLRWYLIKKMIQEAQLGVNLRYYTYHCDKPDFQCLYLSIHSCMHLFFIHYFNHDFIQYLSFHSFILFMSHVNPFLFRRALYVVHMFLRLLFYFFVCKRLMLASHARTRTKICRLVSIRN